MLRLKINEIVYDFSDLQNQLNQLFDDAIHAYHTKLSPDTRIGMKLAYRSKIEPWLEKTFGEAIRPKRHTDPIEHAVYFFLNTIQDALSHATISLTISEPSKSEYDTVSNLSIEFESTGEGWGQLATSREEGEWQDNVLEIPSISSGSNLSDISYLHSGYQA